MFEHVIHFPFWETGWVLDNRLGEIGEGDVYHSPVCREHDQPERRAETRRECPHSNRWPDLFVPKWDWRIYALRGFCWYAFISLRLSFSYLTFHKERISVFTICVAYFFFFGNEVNNRYEPLHLFGCGLQFCRVHGIRISIGSEVQIWGAELLRKTDFGGRWGRCSSKGFPWFLFCFVFLVAFDHYSLQCLGFRRRISQRKSRNEGVYADCGSREKGKITQNSFECYPNMSHMVRYGWCFVFIVRFWSSSFCFFLILFYELAFFFLVDTTVIFVFRSFIFLFILCCVFVQLLHFPRLFNCNTLKVENSSPWMWRKRLL